MELILIILQIIVAVLLIGIILLQKTNSDSVSTLSSGVNSFNQYSTSNFFTKATAVLATVFMVNSLALTIVMDKKHHESPIIKKIESTKQNNQDNKDK